jgi:septal ring factor EnvC (AmiA/AmiB activator)
MSTTPLIRELDVLLESRKPDLTYKEKIVKNKIDRVTVELHGNDSAAMTRLASRYERLEQAIKKMSEKRAELNEQIKEQVTDLFDAEDVVLTRVVETASFTLTLSKLIKSSEQDKKVVVNYEKIAQELVKLIPDELQAKVDEIFKMYTEITNAPDKSPALRIKSKVDENLNEGILDTIKGIAVKIAKWVKDIVSWAASYDQKLDVLKKKAGLINTL